MTEISKQLDQLKLDVTKERLSDFTRSEQGNSMTIDFLTSEQRVRTKETLVVQTNQITGQTNSHHAIQQHYDETDYGDLRMVLSDAKLKHSTFDRPEDTSVPVPFTELLERQEKEDRSLHVARAQRARGQDEDFYAEPKLPEIEMPAPREYICAACNNVISGRCITAMLRKFHPEHFVCSFCLKQINKGTFKEKEDKPYCFKCHEKLLG